LKKKSEKIIKIYVLDTQINKKKSYALFFCTLMSWKSEKNGIFLDFRGGNSFREYFLNKPGNLFSNFDILLSTPQRTIYMKFKKIH